MLKSRPILPAALLILLAVGCGGNRTEATPSADADAIVRVENQSTLTMTIYVRPGGGGSRFRLGTVNGLETTPFKLPSNMVRGATDLVFEIDPLGSARNSFSERITARPGEEVVLRIGP